ncbi:MAG: sugar ABC transporter permease [Deltaproteobacteria bacterium]|nr:sugar ABC transporter permease [Deltaproteobacteria bacterium]
MKRLLPHLILALASALVLYPVLWVAKMALTPSQAFDPSPNPLPDQVTFDNFVHVVSIPGFGQQVVNSLVVSVATALVGLGLAMTAAYAFSRFRFPGRQAALTAFLLTQIFPGVVMMIPLYILLDAVGLLDSLAGLVMVYATTSIPFCTWMLKGYIDTLPKELEEAALMDGASRWTLFVRVVLPLCRPALAVTALFAFMTAWNEYILAATFLGTPDRYTLPIVIQRYVGEHGTDWGYFAAGSILTSTVVMALFFVLQKHLVSGLTAGSVKG